MKAGDVVVRLDETQTRSELELILKGLDENAARRARMEAELSGVDKVIFPASLMARIKDDLWWHTCSGPRLTVSCAQGSARGAEVHSSRADDGSP